MNITLRRSIAVAALVIAPVVSSCGFDQPTDRVYTPGVGVNERSGQVDVLNALIVTGAEGSGTLVATLANNSQEQSDQLMEVVGEATVELAGPVPLDPGTSVSLTDEGEISVTGPEIVSGAFVKLTFNFERGESVEVEVPVVPRRGTYSDIPVPSVAPTSAAPEDEESSGSH